MESLEVCDLKGSQELKWDREVEWHSKGDKEF